MTDWTPGDLALCVKGGKSGATKSGGIYTVERVWMHPIGKLCLDFEGIDNGGWGRAYMGHVAYRFIRIPLHAPDAEDEETIRLLRGEPVEKKIAVDSVKHEA